MYYSMLPFGSSIVSVMTEAFGVRLRVNSRGTEDPRDQLEDNAASKVYFVSYPSNPRRIVGSGVDPSFLSSKIFSESANFLSGPGSCPIRRLVRRSTYGLQVWARILG